MGFVEERIEKAIKYINGLDLAALEVGKYTVDENIYYMVQEIDSRTPEVAKLEAHKNYIDIQWMIDGIEKLSVVGLDGLKVKEEYNPEKDVVIYEAPDRMMDIILTPGAYVVLYPENAHRPNVTVYEQTHNKKIVVKVKCVE